MLDWLRGRPERERLRAHGQRAGALVDDALGMPEARRRLLAAPDETLVSAAVVAASRAVGDTPFSSPGSRILTALSRKKLPFEADDVRLLLSLAAGARGRWFPPQIAPTVTIAEGWCGQHGTAGVERELRELMAVVLSHHESGSDRERTALTGRLRPGARDPADNGREKPRRSLTAGT